MNTRLPRPVGRAKILVIVIALYDQFASPTCAEIGALAGVSAAAVSAQTRRLIADGYLRRPCPGPRTLVPTPEGRRYAAKWMPLVGVGALEAPPIYPAGRHG